MWCGGAARKMLRLLCEFFVGMLNINEMYKVCSDFCGVRRWKWFLICVGVMVVYSSICVLVFCLWLWFRCLCAIFILFCLL